MEKNIINLYNEIGEEKKSKFSSSIDSSLKVKTFYDKTTYDDEWLSKMEETIRYLDNILRNPNRFIVNEEDIVKIELARRITVDSIKHLSRNTNFIQDFNQKTGEVRPSKILNINKEESFNTYENRFVYTLINNMKMYIERKKTEDVSDGALKDEKSFDYKGTGKLGNEKVDIALNLNSSLASNGGKNKGGIAERISKVEEKVRDLCSSEVYKNLAKLHVAPVTSPIKKTNLILKNTNFQYALELWNYLQGHMEASTKMDKANKSYEDKGDLKKLMDQSFMLNYMIMRSINDESISEEERNNLTGEAVSNLVNQLVSLNEKLTLDDIKKIVGEEYVKIKYRKIVDTSEIERTYKKAISDYTNKIEHLKVGKHEKNDK